MEIVSEQQARSRAYYQANREAIKARVAKYRLDNPRKVSESKKRCYNKNREVYLARQKVYVQEHREQHRANGRAWELANPEKVRRKNKLWKERNYDKVLESWRKRHAIKLGIPGGHFTNTEFKELCESTGDRCLSCQRVDVELTADHVIPLVFRIPRSDEIWNIQPLCRSCNCKKHTKTTDYRGNQIAVLEFSSTL